MTWNERRDVVRNEDKRLIEAFLITLWELHGKEAKAAMKAAIRSFPEEVLQRAGVSRPEKR